MSESRHVTPEAQEKPTAQATDNAAVSQKLLDDIQGKLMPGSSADTVKKLVDDKVLPDGSTVMDFGAVKQHLAGDQKALKDLQDKKPEDTTAATKDVKTATDGQTAAKGAVDTAQGKVDAVQKKIDDRTKEEAEVKKDFATLSKAENKTSFDKDDLTKLAGDDKQPKEVRDAAQNLLNTVHSETHMASAGKGGMRKVTTDADDYGRTPWYSGTMRIDQKSIDSASAKHQEQNAADKKTMEPLQADLDKAKANKATADTDVKAKQDVLDGLNAKNKGVTDQETKLSGQIKDEQAALTPSGEVDKLGRVVKGGGYYQVAENLLGIDDKGHHTGMQERELKMLTGMLKDEEKRLHGGELPKYLKTNDQLLAPDNLQDMLEKLKAANAPPPLPTTKPSGHQ